MQDAHALLILEAAYNLSESSQDVMRDLAQAARRALPDGPVAVARFDSHARLDPDLVHFEGADQDYVSRFFEWQRMAPIAIRQYTRSLTPRAVNLYSSSCTQLPAELEALARRIFPLCVIANTGDGSGLYIMFGSPCVREWLPAQLQYFQDLAHHLAAAWRLRKALSAPAGDPAAPAARCADDSASGASAESPDATARHALRRTVVAQDRSGSRPRSGKQSLWQALLAGRWSVLDTFMAGGTRYVVACKNPDDGAMLRALHARERAVLELALAGRSGKWTAFELQLSESTVTRTLRTALRRLGVADSTELVGIRTAQFESIAGMHGVDLAMARLTPAVASPDLSDAERAVVTGILGGKRIAAIARERGTSPRTVSNQLASVYKKLGVSSRREVIALLT
jgi:DNA-binding NarL/FixJ family response regulator